MEEDKTKNVVNHFEAGSNCQVFNGDISGCVFAMPGSTVNQNVPQERKEQHEPPALPPKESRLSLGIMQKKEGIVEQLEQYIDKGDWRLPEMSEKVKQMMRAVLGIEEVELSRSEENLSEKLWILLENGRGDRVKIVWQNIVGYLDEKGFFKRKGSPALNKDFFGNEEGYTNIDKGRPNNNNMSQGFADVVPLLDEYLPK